VLIPEGDTLPAGPEPSRAIARFLDLLASGTHLESPSAEAGEQLADSIKRMPKDASVSQWISIYENAVAFTDQVTQTQALRAEALSNRKDELVSRTSLFPRTSISGNPGAAWMSGDKTQVYCRQFRSEWKDRINRQREWLWDEQVFRLFKEIPIVHEQKRNTYTFKADPKWRQTFEQQWHTVLEQWRREVSAGVYKRFVKRFNEQCLSAVETLLDSSEMEMPVFERPLFEVDMEPPAINRSQLEVPGLLASLMKVLKSARFMISFAASLLVPCLAAVFENTADKATLLGKIANQADTLVLLWLLLIIGTVIYLLRERRSAALKNSSGVGKIIASQAEKSADDALRRVQRQMERQTMSWLNKYETSLEQWRKNCLEKSVLERQNNEEHTAVNAQEERARLSKEISALKSDISRWSMTNKQLVSRLNILRTSS
jgi:hypothetical protein